MLFLPYSTDAPIYHLPIATVAFIVSNVVIFFGTMFQVQLGNMPYENIEWLILQFNQINPIQWITGQFMHADIFHLLGNMFFLWCFGLVIEGKIGTIPFAVLYLAMTLIDGALLQIPMYFLSGESGGMGASCLIFGLMTIAIIWAPENEMDCVYWILFRPGTVEVRIVTMGVAFIFLQIVFLVLGGFTMSSEMGHMAGVVTGAPIGFAMLRQGMVDCEGWDIVSRTDTLRNMNLFRSEKQRAAEQHDTLLTDNAVELALGTAKIKKQTKSKRPVHQPIARPANKPKKNPAASKQPEVDKAIANSHPEFNRLAFVFRQAIESKNCASADQAYLHLQKLKLTSGLGERSLYQYASLLGSKNRAVDALNPLRVVESRNGPLANHARLRIALVYLRVAKKPEMASETLRRIVDSPDLKPELKSKRDAMLAEAAKV